MKKNGELIQFLKQKDYVMINSDFGGGSFGKTVLLRDPFIDELFVAKKYEPIYEEDKERFYKNFLDEIKILYKLNHRNIVRIYNYYAYEDIFTGYILMEYIDGKDIGKFINDYVSFLDSVSLDDIFLQLLNGFSYIEKHGIIHRDIRESNILIDKNGTAKIIDFGIGKLFDKTINEKDSLVNDINRAGSDTLPNEYNEGVYTSQTDMFYLAELFNRLLKNVPEPDYIDFTYQDIIDKMMEKDPQNRYSTFAHIIDTIGRRDFSKMKISKEDIRIYGGFTNLIHRSIKSFTDERKFNYDKSILISRLEKTLRYNLFEDNIQNNSDVISSIVAGEYTYYPNTDIPCSIVKGFIEWFKKATPESQDLILQNIVSKLSTIEIAEKELELPF